MPQTIEHLLFNCYYVKPLWRVVESLCNIRVSFEVILGVHDSNDYDNLMKLSVFWFIRNGWYCHHTIIRAAFVCLFVCLSVCLFVPLLLQGPLTDLRQTCWVYVGGPRNCPSGVNRSNVTFSEQTTPGWDHTAAKGTASFAQQKAHCI